MFRRWKTKLLFACCRPNLAANRALNLALVAETHGLLYIGAPVLGETASSKLK